MGVVGTQVAISVPFDNSSNGFTADEVQSAIEEAAASSGADNFSYKLIDIGESVTIPTGQQMLHQGTLTVLGDLITRGDLIEENPDHTTTFGLGTIPIDQLIFVPLNKILFCKNLKIQGTLRVQGDTVEL